MADTFTREERSRIMAAVRSRDTTPERIVRQLVWRLGYRYRLHVSDLPGAPDLVFRRMKKIIFVHGCFWHAHSCRRGRRLPKTQRKYWRAKRERNAGRDRRTKAKLHREGWRVLTIWECQLRDLERVMRRISKFLQTT